MRRTKRWWSQPDPLQSKRKRRTKSSLKRWSCCLSHVPINPAENRIFFIVRSPGCAMTSAEPVMLHDGHIQWCHCSLAGHRALVDELKHPFLFQVQEIHEGLYALRRMVSDLENKQKTVLGVALPEDSKLCSPTGSELGTTSRTWGKGGEDCRFSSGRSLLHKLKLCGALNSLYFSVGMKKELQTLREEIKTLAGQIQRKLKGEFSLISCGVFFL